MNTALRLQTRYDHSEFPWCGASSLAALPTYRVFLTSATFECAVSKRSSGVPRDTAARSLQFRSRLVLLRNEHDVTRDLFDLALCVAAFGVVATNAAAVHAAPPTRTEFCSVTEQWAEKLVRIRQGGAVVSSVETRGVFTIQGAIPLTGVDITTFGVDTTFLLFSRVTALYEDGGGAAGLPIRLGDDPQYIPGVRRANVAVSVMDATGRTRVITRVRLSWTAAVMNFTVTATDDSTVGGASLFADDLADIREAAGPFVEPGRGYARLFVRGVSGGPAQAGRNFTLRISGRVGRKAQVVSGESFTLNTVSLRAEASDVSSSLE